jgi:uncharacterized RDD family membrane protein YckC
VQSSVQPIGTQAAGFGTRLLSLIIEIVIFSIPAGISSSMAASSPDGGGIVPMLFGLVSLALFIYQLVLYASGKSIGKKIMGLTVVYDSTIRPVSFWRMLGREIIGKMISSLIFYLGFLWALWDSRKQTWHDKIFGTLVIKDGS